MKKMIIFTFLGCTAVFVSGCFHASPTKTNTNETQLPSQEIDTPGDMDIYLDDMNMGMPVPGQTDIVDTQVDPDMPVSNMQALPTRPMLPPSINKNQNNQADVLPSPSVDTISPSQESIVIVYTNQGFVPSSVVIKKGDAVTFVNNSSRPFWPASGVHPTHDLYPEKGGCIGSAFDACKALSANEQYTFVFQHEGNWPFHDHLRAQFTGRVIVE